MSEPIREPLPENVQADAPEPNAALPLRWHRFQMHFLLFVMAAAQAFQAYCILSGKMYYTAAVRDQVYAGIPGLRIADIALAALLLMAAALMLAARGKLRKNKWRGVGLLKAAWALAALAPAMHALARFFIAGLTPLNIGALARLLGCGALLPVNGRYYRRRRELFH